MNAYRASEQSTDRTYTLIQVVLAVAGAFYILTGLALLGVPEWFFQNIGNFPPFNRHYAGDLGTFTLALGLGLLVAARDPAKHRLLVGVAALASILHALNHGYDDLTGASPATRLLADTLPLLIFGLVLAFAYIAIMRRPQEI
ncbi:MAG: DUF6632 domain-containing protein [Chloroflexia bacterium]